MDLQDYTIEVRGKFHLSNWNRRVCSLHPMCPYKKKVRAKIQESIFKLTNMDLGNIYIIDKFLCKGGENADFNIFLSYK